MLLNVTCCARWPCVSSYTLCAADVKICGLPLVWRLIEHQAAKLDMYQILDSKAVCSCKKRLSLPGGTSLSLHRHRLHQF